MILSYPQAKSIVICGDIHGDFETLVYKITMQYQMSDTLVIVAGDCGFGFAKRNYYERIFNKIQKRLSSHNNWIAMVRGNHDNPLYFNGEEKINHKRWRTIPDYSIIQACNHNILCVGGAISIDRYWRKQEMTINNRELYWIDEPPYFNETKLNELKLENINIDTVISHTAPSFCELQTKLGLITWANYDKQLLNDCDQERKTMDLILKKLKSNNHKITNWYYAHFHQSWQSHINKTKFVMLDIMELQELK